MEDDGGKVVIVGICAMEKKTQSKPMKEILTRLQEFEYIKVIVFEEEVILNVRNLRYLFTSLQRVLLFHLDYLVLNHLSLES